MTVCTPISTSSKNVVCLIGSVQRQMVIRVNDAFMQPPNYCCTLGKHPRSHHASVYSSKASSCSPINGKQAFQSYHVRSGTAKHSTSCKSLTFKSIVSPRHHRKRLINVSTGYQNMNIRLLACKQSQTSKIKGSIGPFFWQERSLSAGLFIGFLVCFCTPQPSYADALDGDKKKEGYCDASSKKKVLTDYSVIGIPGDGRCMFRSVAHGACLREGKSAPNETLQRELADQLRTRVADEFMKRRKETEWFIEGDFDTYVSQMRKPHVWGGEPELLMASHVLQMPITVYMHDEDAGGLISIAEYGQEYGKDNPILVLYHGYGHYDALHVPSKGGRRPRL